MARVKLVSISCFLNFSKRVFNQFENILPQNKDSEVVSVRKMRLTCLKYSVTKISESSEFNFSF